MHFRKRRGGLERTVGRRDRPLPRLLDPTLTRGVPKHSFKEGNIRIRETYFPHSLRSRPGIGPMYLEPTKKDKYVGVA